jgi:hypothetical protein
VPGVDYPRIAEQSTPRHCFCERWKDAGRRTVATWICIQCSNRQQREALICEECLDEAHEEHWADKILY